jgi:hypothetical protein
MIVLKFANYTLLNNISGTKKKKKKGWYIYEDTIW